MDRKLTFLMSLSWLIAVSALADSSIFTPTTFQSGSSLTITSGVPLQGTWTFASGSTLDVTLASKIGFPSGGGGGTGDVVGPASATDTAVALFDGTTGKLVKNSLVTIDSTGRTSGMLFGNSALKIEDIGGGQMLILRNGTNLSVDRTLTFLPGDANRNLTIAANASISGTYVVAAAKTLTVNNTLTFNGTDSSTLDIGAGGTLGSAAFTSSSAYQPLDSDLTSIAALTTVAFGRGTLELATAGAFRTYIGAGTSSFDGTFASLTGKPTTLTGYGITDPVVLTSGSYADPAWITSLAYSKVTGVPAFEPALGNPAGDGLVLSSTAAGVRSWVAPGSSGTVTSFSSGNLAPLFSTSVATATTTPSLTFVLSNAGPNSWLGNSTGLSAAPAYNAAGVLTEVDDTNVTMTLGGTPASSLLKSVSLTLGWAGTLAAGRLNSNVVQSVTNDTNVTGSISSQALTLGWTGTLAISRGGFGAATAPSLTFFGNTTGATAAPSFQKVPTTAIIGALPTSQGGVPTGGTTTQILQKNTATNYDTSWVDLGSLGGGTVTTFSAGAFSPLFTTTVSTATTTPALAFVGSNATAGTWFGNANALSAQVAAFNPWGALTAANDTNVTLTLGGTPTQALLKAASITAGWTGTLAVARGGTGAATAPANTFFMNNTAAVAAPSFQTAAAADLSNGVTGSGTIALSVSPTFTGTAVFATINPTTITGAGTTITRTIAIQGSNTNDAAGAGNVGETVTSAIAATGAVAYATGTNKNLTSVSLTAGDWDVRGLINGIFTSLPAAGIANVQAQVNTTTLTITDDGTQAVSYISNSAASAQSMIGSASLPPKRVSLSAPTTVFLVGKLTGGGTLTAYGYIEARRMR